MKRTRQIGELYEYNILARMIQVGMIAYLAGGAFLSLSYFDLAWHFIAIALLLETQINRITNQRAVPALEMHDTAAR